MAKFRKKPVEIEAAQMVGAGEDFTKGVPEWLQEAFDNEEVTFDFDNSEWIVRTLEDGKNWTAKDVGNPGDWLIRGVKGEMYFCKPDIFAVTYEPVS